MESPLTNSCSGKTYIVIGRANYGRETVVSINGGFANILCIIILTTASYLSSITVQVKHRRPLSSPLSWGIRLTSARERSPVLYRRASGAMSVQSFVKHLWNRLPVCIRDRFRRKPEETQQLPLFRARLGHGAPESYPCPESWTPDDTCRESAAIAQIVLAYFRDRYFGIISSSQEYDTVSRVRNLRNVLHYSYIILKKLNEGKLEYF